MAKHSFILNGKRVEVECEGSVRLLWVLRDILGVTGPKYGCGLRVCRACTCHINGKAFNPCSVPVDQIKRDDRITTIEGLPAEAGQELHPMQHAWLDYDVAQCGYCQPGQIMRPWRWCGSSRPRASPSPRPIWTRSATSAAVALTRGSARRSGPGRPR
jgi:isoquinoline 1-oxidoreductase alpha subunit